MSIFDAQNIDLTCAMCRGRTPKSVGWIKENPIWVCECGAVNDLDANPLIQELKNIDDQLSEVT